MSMSTVLALETSRTNEDPSPLPRAIGQRIAGFRLTTRRGIQCEFPWPGSWAGAEELTEQLLERAGSGPDKDFNYAQIQKATSAIQERLRGLS
jgi:hypothetical protein